MPKEVEPNPREHAQMVATETQAVPSKPVAVEPVDEEKKPPPSAPVIDQQKQAENNQVKLDLRPKGSSTVAGGGECFLNSIVIPAHQYLFRSTTVAQTTTSAAFGHHFSSGLSEPEVRGSVQ